MRMCLFHNLPDGGARRLFFGLAENLSFLVDKIDIYSHPEKKKRLFKCATIKNVQNYIPIPWLVPANSKKYLNYILLGRYEKLCADLAKKIDGQKYDSVILGGDWITQASILANFLKTPCFHIAHELKREFYERTEWGNFRKMKQFFWKKLVKKLKNLEIESLNNSVAIIVSSKFSLEKFKKVVIDKKKIKVIYPFVDSLFLSHNKKIRKRDNFFLSVGSFSYLKGHDFVIKSLQKMHKKYHFPLYLVGKGGPHLQEIMALARKSNLELVIKNSVSDLELLNLYQKSKGLFFFPRDEPFGLVALEALTANTKVFAVNEGGFAEIAKESKNCELIPRNSEILLNSVIKYIKNPEIKRDVRFSRFVKSQCNISTYTKRLLDIVKK